MMKKIKILSLVALLLITILCFTQAAQASSAAADYLCEVATNYYNQGRLDDALVEFKKVLILQPENETAKNFINDIFNKNSPSSNKKTETNIPPVIKQPVYTPEIPAVTKQEDITPAPAKIGQPSITPENEPNSLEEISFAKNQAITAALNNLDISEQPPEQSSQPTQPHKKDGNGEEGTDGDTVKKSGFLKINGEVQLAVGITPEDSFIWKRADCDLNEKNWRILSDATFNNRTNTYDPRVFDRLRLNLDTENDEGFNFHSNITVDPWSFTGKSKKMTIKGEGGDEAEIELKYWSNTGYTIPESIYTLNNGDAFALPEIKVINGESYPTRITSLWTNKFNIPEMKIERQFQPIRELWFDYKKDDNKIRFFPFAYQDQALNTDDPLHLSNNHIWWEESPWLDRWKQGRLNSGGNPDFTKGRFDDSISYMARDSDGTRLTLLRGLAFEFRILEDLSLLSTFASPKDPWQDYEKFDNIINATRLNYKVLDNLSVGTTYTYRVGFNEENKRDVYNNVWGFDAGYEICEGLKATAEVATSQTKQDLTSPDYATKTRGSAYHFSIFGSFPRKELMDLKYGFNELKPGKTDTNFTKYRFYGAHMDTGFDPKLASYRETRDDTFWSRHIHFRQPFKYYAAGLYYPTLKWEDVEPFRIGNGMDSGRDVLGFRLETSLWNKKFENLFDLRNVHATAGGFLENVARDEITYKVTDKLTAKVLGIYHRVPRTKDGIDPFVVDSNSGNNLLNAAIEPDLNASLKTGSLGLEYAFTDWLALSGVWERTNDTSLAYDNFPRGVLNSSSLYTYQQYGKYYRDDLPFLYSQGLYPLPPYPFYNIFKAGLSIEPMENMEIYLDYTRNEFKSAGQIDDNINHIGIEASYRPTKKLGFYTRYTYSRWNDINRMVKGEDKIYLSHHNFFAEIKYMPDKDSELTLQYGESGRSPVAIIAFDPFGSGLSTLDTRHIIRLYYRRKF